MKVITPGHNYILESFEGTKPQELQFIHKEPESDSNPVLLTLSDGTTNEEVLRVLIDRLTFLDNKFPCEENKTAIDGLVIALSALQIRTLKRQQQNVEGKQIAHSSD